MQDSSLFLTLSESVPIGEIIDTGKEFGMNLCAGMYDILLFKVSMPTNGAVEKTGHTEPAKKLQSDDGHKEARYDRKADVFSAVDEVVASIPYVFSFQRGIDGWAYLIVGDDQIQIESRVRHLTERLTNALRHYESAEYFGGIGQPVSRLGELKSSFEGADRTGTLS